MSIHLRRRHLVRALGSLVAGAAALGGFTGNARAATFNAVNGSSNCQTVVIKSTANQQYVSAELGYSGNDYGMLRARSGSVGPWEQFSQCSNPLSGAVTLQSVANGLWVSAELNYGGSFSGELRARATSIGSWEQFRVVGAPGGASAIQSAASGQFVSAEIGWGGSTSAMLRARSASVGPWEQFVVTPVTLMTTDSGWVSYDGGCQARTQVKYWTGTNVASVDTQVKDPYLFVACRVNATMVFDTPSGPANGPTQTAMACAVTDPTCASSTDTGWQTFSNAYQGGTQAITDIRVNLTKA